MTVANGALFTPAFSFVGGEASALSMRHVGYSYGAHTSASFSCNDEVGYTRMHEDTGLYVEDIFLTFGVANSDVRAKFGSTSILFPAGGYVTFPATIDIAQFADFSIEFWGLFENDDDMDVVHFVGGGAFGRKSRSVGAWLGSTGGGALQSVAYTWNHYALTRSGNIVRGFFDGQLQFSYVFTDAFKISGFGNPAGHNGRFYLDSVGISNNWCRYTDSFGRPTLPFNVVPSSSGALLPVNISLVPSTAKGSLLTPAEYDPQWSKTAFLLGGAGQEGATNIAEAKGRSYRKSGVIMYSNSQAKFGETSIQFAGDGWMAFTMSADMDLHYGDFTIEAWFYPVTAHNGAIISRSGDLRRGWSLFFLADNRVRFNFNTLESGESSLYGGPVALNTWNFVSVTRTGDEYRINVNGVRGDVLNTPYAIYRNVTRMYPGSGYGGDYRDWDVPMVIGADSEIGSGGYNFHGYMQDVRITVGYSRYPDGGPITGIPSKAFTPTGSGVDGDTYWADVKSLIHFDEIHGTVSGVRDARGNQVTLKTSAFISGNPGAGKHGNALDLWFVDAAGASLPLSSDFDLSINLDFTVEVSICEFYNAGAALLGQFTTDPIRGWYINMVNYDGPPATPGYGGYIQFVQYNELGINDVVMGPLNSNTQHRWTHIAMQRRGNVHQLFVDGVPGPETTISRRPAQVAVPLHIGTNHWKGTDRYDEFRFTRAARYPSTGFIPLAGKFPEYPFEFGNAILSETTSFVPASPRAAVRLPGAIIITRHSLQIPKVASPTIDTNTIVIGSAAKGGEGAGETFSINETINFRLSFRDSDSMSYGDDAFVQFVAGAGSGMSIGDAVSVTLGNVGVNESIGIAEEIGSRKTMFESNSDSVAFNSRQKMTLGLHAAGGFGFSGIPTMTKNILVQTRMLFNEIVGSQFTFTIIQQEGIGIVDSDVSFSFGAEAVDSFSLSETASRDRRSSPVIVENFMLHGGVGGGVNISMVVPEGLILSDDMSPSQQLALIVSESIQLSDFFSSPTFTTWVMNTRTTAVSEYDGFSFNSFAKLGERYIGANESGLYWIDGDTDSSKPIQAVIQPGVIQPHGNKMANVVSAYLGMRGNASFVITVKDEAGGSYDYPIDIESMKTGRVKFGRGLKTRYLTFRVVSDGGDFDLDNIEFVTSETSRKVIR